MMTEAAARRISRRESSLTCILPLVGGRDSILLMARKTGTKSLIDDVLRRVIMQLVREGDEVIR